jgi:hypothetical protein
MATQLFLRDLPPSTPYLFSTGNNDAPIGTASWGATVGWTDQWLATTRGVGVNAPTRATLAGNTTGIEFPANVGGSFPAAWISPPLDQDITIAGTITFNLWMGENTTSVNAGAMCVVERITSTGAIDATVASSVKGTELPKISAIAAQNWTVTATSTAFLKGDRIRIRVLMKNVGTMGADATGCQFNYSGTTAGASGDSYVTFTETFGFLTTDPTTTTIYPTSIAAGIDPGALTELEAWTSRGGSALEEVFTPVNGWTAPIEASTHQWFTKPLQAFTLAAPVLVSWRGYEDSSSVNSSPRVELAVVATDGTSPTVWGATTSSLELFSTAGDDAHTFYVAGDDLAVTDGQRLRIRCFIDDIPSAAMAQSGGLTSRMSYNGATGGASGDTFLKFGQTLTEFVAAVALPYLVMAPKVPV